MPQTQKEMLDLRTVNECNRCLGMQTLHPQATLVSLENPGVGQNAVKFEFYAILLIESCPDGCTCCGRKYDDYACATMVFLKPGEVFRMSKAGALPDKGWLLAFHPDLLFRTTLKAHLSDYTFFDYRKEEALHLSQRETATVTCCLHHIDEELHHAIDTHTATILSRHIELMLDYCARFYERQFITRENRNHDLLKRLSRQLDDSLARGDMRGGRGPKAADWADALGLSAAYFADLLRFETGMTFSEYLQLRRLDMAKRLLRQGDGTPAEVADRLGYPSVQYFSFLFKKITGMAPADYRWSGN